MPGMECLGKLHTELYYYQSKLANLYVPLISFSPSCVWPAQMKECEGVIECEGCRGTVGQMKLELENHQHGPACKRKTRWGGIIGSKTAWLWHWSNWTEMWYISMYLWSYFLEHFDWSGWFAAGRVLCRYRAVDLHFKNQVGTHLLRTAQWCEWVCENEVALCLAKYIRIICDGIDNLTPIQVLSASDSIPSYLQDDIVPEGDVHRTAVHLHKGRCVHHLVTQLD